MPPAPEVRVIGRNKPTLQGRCIGILFDEGSDARVIASLSKAARKAGADVKLVAPKWEAPRSVTAAYRPLMGNWPARHRPCSMRWPWC